MIQTFVGKLLRICIDKLRFGEAENMIFFTPIKSLILFSTDSVLAFPSHFGLSFR